MMEKAHALVNVRDIDLICLGTKLVTPKDPMPADVAIHKRIDLQKNFTKTRKDYQVETLCVLPRHDKLILILCLFSWVGQKEE